MFSGDKVVGSYLLNVLGAQIFRTVTARSIFNSVPVLSGAFRSSPGDTVKKKFAELRREGIVVWPDFLPRDEFERVRQECFNLIRDNSQVEVERWGPNTLEIRRVRDGEAGAMSSIYRLIADRRLRGILEAAEKRPLGPLTDRTTVERLTQGEAKNLEDPQSQVHSDTFHTCHKAWLYVSDVGMEDGPLFYVKGSHKMTLRQLYYIYRHSYTIRQGDDQSRRITADELSKLGGPKEIYTCASNTLVIANTCGYHGRLQGEAKRERWTVHLNIRANPFSSFLKRLLRLA
jgi:hypothetical protein